MKNFLTLARKLKKKTKRLADKKPLKPSKIKKRKLSKKIKVQVQYCIFFANAKDRSNAVRLLQVKLL